MILSRNEILALTSLRKGRMNSSWHDFSAQEFLKEIMFKTTLADGIVLTKDS